MNISNIVIGLGSIIGGVQALKQGVQQSPRSSNTSIDRFPFEQMLGKNKGAPLKASFHKVGTIDERVKHVVNMIQKGRRDPNVRAFAVKAVSKKCGKDWCIAERDWWGECAAVFKAIRKNARYVRDAWRLDTFQHPGRTLEFGGGDCDDYTILSGSALQAIGFPVKVRVIQTAGSPDFNHVFLIVGLPPRAPTKWAAFDTSINRPPGWHPPRNMIQRIKDYEVP